VDPVREVAEHRALSDAPLLLALESATNLAGVALLRGDVVLGAFESDTGQQHSERLLPMVDALLREHALGLGDLEAFAISIGPGSFTSLRIGLSTIKGLAFGSDVPVAPVSTLEALAAAAGEPGPIAACLDARRGELYAGAWATPGAEPDQVVPESVYTPHELLEQLPEGSRIVGEGVALFEEEQRARAADRGIDVEPVAGATRPSAVAVGRLGLGALARGEGQRAEELVPRYVRRAEAEVQRTAQRFE
jgi:tRNA threonylcarbamoyladenosine biosynthesis protein TsaB